MITKEQFIEENGYDPKEEFDLDYDPFEELTCKCCGCTFQPVDFEGVDDEYSEYDLKCPDCQERARIDKETCEDCDRPAEVEIGDHYYCSECADDHSPFNWD